jgi:4,4'-diaponeurosporenoate glycosyltransferase
VLLAWFDLMPSAASTLLFTVGWMAGWLMLWRGRRLPSAAVRRRSIAVVVPARNEATSIGVLVRSVVPQLRAGDEFVVVDDHSSDDTAAIARAAGATVIECPVLPDGWAGKPHACHVGAIHTTAEIVLFLDADVHLGPGELDRLATAVTAAPNTLVSMQPWHRTERAVEQWSMPFNIAALMGSAAFTVAGSRVRPRVAFGPVMALTRAHYEAIGGHAHPAVRSAVLEDIALARLATSTELFTGSPSGTTFQMYPDGIRSLVEGWTKGIGIGFDSTPWWAAIATAAWVTSVAGGWLTSPWFAVATLVQVGVLARRAGGFRWYSVVGAPVLVAFFAAVSVGSIFRRYTGRAVTWKGRSLRPDQETG